MAPLPYPVILSGSMVALALVAIVTWVVSGSFIAAVVVLSLAAVIGYILMHFGTVKVRPTDAGIDIDVEPIPGPRTDDKHKHTYIKEVFHVSDNTYSYDDAPAVCAAYGGELASYDQLIEAHSQGAEWCGYGWSAAGMALYPTQAATWEALQRDPKEAKRTACGHPGVNGGYFDPRLKFGVNCYGHKPRNRSTQLPIPLPGTDEDGFNKMVNKFKAMLASMKLSPYNRDQWSKTGYGNKPHGLPTPSVAPASNPSPYGPSPSNPNPYGPSPSDAKKPSNTPTDEASSYDQMVDSLCKTFGICRTTNGKGDSPSASSHTSDIERNIEKRDPSERRRIILEQAAKAGVAPPPDNATNAEVAEWRKKNNISG